MVEKICRKDISIAAENSATRSPDICYCGGKPIKKQNFTAIFVNVRLA